MKGGAAIEQIGRAKAVAFDKTGTITFGTPFAERIASVDSTSSDDLLYKAGCIEQLSSHGVARAITRLAMDKFPRLELPSNFKESPGSGVEGDLGSEHIAIGSKRFIESVIGKDPFEEYPSKRLIGYESQGRLVAFITITNKLCGSTFLLTRFGEEFQP